MISVEKCTRLLTSPQFHENECYATLTKISNENLIFKKYYKLSFRYHTSLTKIQSEFDILATKKTYILCYSIDAYKLFTSRFNIKGYIICVINDPKTFIVITLGSKLQQCNHYGYDNIDEV